MKTKSKFLLPLLWLGTSTLIHAGEKPMLTANATNYFTISGMHCDGCAGGLTAELKETPGVINAQVTFSNKLAVVAIDTNKISSSQLTKVIKAAGFGAKTAKP